ncbi:alanine-glyoxylate transaminase/serine-glyoxylate transaminase/serine-pyruvate transaminase [Brevibacterium sanguinis]|uniref:Tritium exchange subunit n=2 Tax=Brevibacterium TaxID=1696 RepID=A0A366IGT6_9MICO|nr:MULTISPECIES: aminotransferase class V-fold PLP-dependent enzyme [Brevibacterium]RBP62025.1 alanine-glyoxylate transaminase/serine-glyoxylate transaminase/serine-pyruvate transaminase [Brevibacterium sanguinis]RBP70553.1 alanine-glyoxylate transaminase/serine-glyoxylate transaminase/serine-pyruvate transaminase [Brevibacterium celere]
MTRPSGRHFLQIPGPSNVPDTVLRAISMPTIDHRGPEFQELFLHVLEGMAKIFGTRNQVVIYPATGTGAWEAALVNTLSPGDEILCYETGHFSSLWKSMAERWGLKPTTIPGDWRTGADPEKIRAALENDSEHRFKAVCVVHNETSTGVTSRIPEIRRAIDETGHPALFMVDTISSLGSVDYRHDEWRVDVTVSGSQKGLMLPPGLSFTAVSDKALEAHERSTLPKSVWNWSEMLAAGRDGRTPYTPNTNILFGLKESLRILDEEGLENVFARHRRFGKATRTAVDTWGLEVLCTNENEHSPVLTAVVMPDGQDADELRAIILDKFNMSLGAGLSKLAGKVFRIGHLGDLSDLTLAGTLAGVQMGLQLAGVKVDPSGLEAALDVLRDK